jgi:hypothetical protein
MCICICDSKSDAAIQGEKCPLFGGAKILRWLMIYFPFSSHFHHNDICLFLTFSKSTEINDGVPILRCERCLTWSLEELQGPAGVKCSNQVSSSPPIYWIWWNIYFRQISESRLLVSLLTERREVWKAAEDCFYFCFSARLKETVVGVILRLTMRHETRWAEAETDWEEMWL